MLKAVSDRVRLCLITKGQWLISVTSAMALLGTTTTSCSSQNNFGRAYICRQELKTAPGLRSIDGKDLPGERDLLHIVVLQPPSGQAEPHDITDVIRPSGDKYEIRADEANQGPGSKRPGEVVVRASKCRVLVSITRNMSTDASERLPWFIALAGDQ